MSLYEINLATVKIDARSVEEALIQAGTQIAEVMCDRSLINDGTTPRTAVVWLAGVSARAALVNVGERQANNLTRPATTSTKTPMKIHSGPMQPSGTFGHWY
jgi:NADH dehydrogenase FAD-containing subunit